MSRPQPNPAGWLWGLGAATVVVAARWREIELHGGEVPFLDQWLVEARQILLPWVEGRLTFADFFLPHHEHVPAWPRLLAWLEAVIFGRWDGQLQATLNAVLMGGFTGLLAAGLRRALPLVPALTLTALAVVLGSLPHSWENIVWGFQSHIPLALLFVLLHVHGSFARPPGAAGWWLAQAAGLAAFFTLGSMWAAPLAVLLVLLWTRRPGATSLLAAGLLTAAGVVLLVAARMQQPVTGAYAMAATNLPQFSSALLTQLGWPSVWPGAALLVNLPVFLLAGRLRRHSSATALDCTVLALALWAAGQAVAFAYARGSYIGFVSRYGDLLALGVIANGVALWRLVQAGRWWPRVQLTLLALGWTAAIALGLRNINVQGHTLYFHEHSAAWVKLRRDAVHQYLVTRDPAGLAAPDVRAGLFPDPAEVAGVLANPRLVALLPGSVQPDGPARGGDFLAGALRDLRGFWGELAGCGGLLLLFGAALTVRGDRTSPPDTTLPAGARSGPAAGFALLAAGAGALIFIWPHPFEFQTELRWARYVSPAGTLPGLGFHIVTETNYPKDNLTGGAALWPEKFRNTFFGTHIDGPAFTGVAQSTPFRLDSPWYVVPYAGYPVSAGNALRLQIEDAAGNPVAELQCPGPNPGPGPTDIGFWAVDVRPYAGRTARLMLYDGRTDAEGWVAVAPPQPSADGERTAAAHRRGWAAEGTLSGLQSLQVIAVAAALLAAGAVVGSWLERRRSHTPRPAGHPS